VNALFPQQLVGVLGNGGLLGQPLDKLFCLFSDEIVDRNKFYVACLASIYCFSNNSAD